MPPLPIDLRDLHPGEGLEKVRAAAARYRLDEVADRASFDAGYALLDAEFGPNLEIERHDTLARWFDAGSLSALGAPIRATYHMILAHDADGTIAGIRDCFVALDRDTGYCVVLLSHSLVFPAHRRSGLAALLRHAPLALCHRRIAAEARGPEAGRILLAAEMEQVTPEDKASVVRLVAYGRAGYRAVPPPVLPYAQPDFREEVQRGEMDPEPLPFLAVVRQVGEEHLDTISAARVEAIVRHFQGIHTSHCRAEHLVPIREHALGALARSGLDPVPLLRLPATTRDVVELAPLLRSVAFPLYPKAWQGREPLADPAEELAALVATWNPPEPR